MQVWAELENEKLKRKSNSLFYTVILPASTYLWPQLQCVILDSPPNFLLIQLMHINVYQQGLNTLCTGKLFLYQRVQREHHVSMNMRWLVFRCSYPLKVSPFRI
jgi:hypothetical protein